jgi:hypothetical protein
VPGLAAWDGCVRSLRFASSVWKKAGFIMMHQRWVRLRKDNRNGVPKNPYASRMRFSR